jgi:hypothetical protein
MEARCDGADRSQLAWNGAQRQAFVNTVMNFHVPQKVMEFFD